MASPWRTLHLPPAHLPQLLVKAKLDSSGYTVHLTDLSRVWGETLSKRDVRKRADSNDCAIDPGEGDDQYRILQEKIEAALDQADGTGLILHSAPGGEDGVILTLTAPLPSPLPALTWEMQLALLPAHHVEAELVTPLLHRAQNQQAQIRALIHELHEKDRVISKITDRLETSGNELTTVFPGVSNIKVKRSKSQREQLAKHVSGLGDFDEEAWGKRVRGAVCVDGEARRLEGEALDAVLKGLPGAGVKQDAKKGDGSEWWRNLGDGDGVDSGDRPSSVSKPGTDKRHDSQRSGHGMQGPSSSETAVPDDIDMPDNQDDEFQRQGTPPRLKRHEPESADDHEETQRIPSSLTQEREPPPPAAEGDGSSTEDDDEDLDAPPQKPGKSQQRSGTTKQQTRQRTNSPPGPDMAASTPRTVAAIGGRKKRSSLSSSPAKEASPETDVSPPKQKAVRTKLGALGGKAKASATPEPAKPPRAKLGAIGGRGGKLSKATATPPDLPAPTSAYQPPPDAAPTSSASSSPAAKHHRLGTIGGKKATATATGTGTASSTPLHEASAAEPSTRGSTREPSPRRSRQPERTTAKEATPPPRETSQERADRKRDELKRQLEEKAKAPVKKKRKF
ncbi:hypothetical protein LTR36_005705 [Oleoguttula mirabilis]|uniref:Non-homologous end-joining factor 1 n=1 Tax=Oleoguttula mirabilis TaxID=1507867 RepID=A0AAV9JEA7_9PEZI|nr:hypothetical protein LTR36_005705 [Oleoguttula mirabilis]